MKAKSSGAAGRPGLSRETKKGLRGWIFVAPFAIGMVFFYGKVIIDAVLYSFYDISMQDSLVMVYQGLSNYREALFVNPDFNRTLVESVQKMLFEIPTIIIFSLLTATILNQKMRGRAFFRAVFFIPVILTTGIIEQAELNNTMMNAVMGNMTLDTGAAQGAGQELLNALDMQKLLLSLNLTPQISSFVIGLVNNIYDVVTKSGVQILVFLAGLQSISPSIYESAQMEGASGWEQLWKITFPMISPMIYANIIFTIIDSFTRPSNALMSTIQTVGFSNSRYGLASAMSWLYALVIVLFIAVTTAVSYRLIFYQQKD